MNQQTAWQVCLKQGNEEHIVDIFKVQYKNQIIGLMRRDIPAVTHYTKDNDKKSGNRSAFSA